MSLRDRGTIKWTSMMLPEHVQILKDMWEEDKLDKAPELDEQALEELNTAIMTAFENQQEIHLHMYHNGSFHEYHGFVQKLLPQQRAIKLITMDNSTYTIQIASIIQIS